MDIASLGRVLRREPLVRFLALGALMFAVDRGVASSQRATIHDTHRIVVADAFVSGLRQRYRERTGVEPADAEVDGLVRDFVREEALYREALAAELDLGDLIVRRRLVQKLEFVVAASMFVDPPDEATLEAWLSTHEESFRRPGRIRFTHVFFSHDVRGDGALEQARSALGASGPTERGEPFLPGAELGPMTDVQIDAVMGPGFAASLAELPEGAWTGPVSSGFGAHLVRIESREPARAPLLDEVRPRVLAGWLDEARRRETDTEIERILSTYTVVRE